MAIEEEEEEHTNISVFQSMRAFKNLVVFPYSSQWGHLKFLRYLNLSLSYNILSISNWSDNFLFSIFLNFLSQQWRHRGYAVGNLY